LLSSIHRLVCAALLALAAPTIAGAHELGKVQVHATFLKGGTYQIELVLDEEHLTPQDVGGPAGATLYGAIAGLPAEVDQRFGRLFRSLVDGAVVGFDGETVRPQVDFLPPDPEAPPGRMTVRLSGPIPGGARAFTWSESAVAGSYPRSRRARGTRAPPGNGWRGARRASLSSSRPR